MNRIISEELRPCPFCGSEAEYMNYGPDGQMVRCSECCAIVDKDTKELAFEAWNTRSLATTLDLTGLNLRWDPVLMESVVTLNDLKNHIQNAGQAGHVCDEEGCGGSCLNCGKFSTTQPQPVHGVPSFVIDYTEGFIKLPHGDMTPELKRNIEDLLNRQE